MKSSGYSHTRWVLLVSLMLCTTLSTAAAVAAGPVVSHSGPVGTGLYEIAYDANADSLYVAASGKWDARTRVTQGAAINVVDPASLAVVRQLSLGSDPVFGLGLNSRTHTLYGTHSVSGHVSAMDMRTGQVLANIADPHNPRAQVRDVVVDETANRIYVSVVGGFTFEKDGVVPKSAIWVVDGSSNTLADIIVDPVKTATGLAIDATTHRLYIADMAQNQVGVIDLETLKPTAYYRAFNETEVEIAPSAHTGKRENGGQNIAVDPQGQRLFVTNPGSGTLSVIDARTGRSLHTVRTGPIPLDVAWNGVARQIYVTNRGQGDNGCVTVIDGDSYAVLAQLKTGTYPQSLAVDAAGQRIFVSNKARELPRDAAPGTPVMENPQGDTLAVIQL